jgi:hypothetical protein
MGEHEDYARGTREIEIEIQRKGLALGIDWNNREQVHALAREALDQLAADVMLAAASPTDYALMAKVELFGLVGLMLRAMERSAGLGFLSHGGKIWKTFARALWEEKQLRQSRPAI